MKQTKQRIKTLKEDFGFSRKEAIEYINTIEV